MPGTFTGLGVTFLYPDNWEISDQIEATTESAGGVTLETPEGAFFALNRYPNVANPQTVIDQALAVLREEYEPLEVEPCGALAADPELAALGNQFTEAGNDLSFYVLDLLITARLIAIVHEGDVLLLQMQAESRDFAKLEIVFAAVLKTLRDSLQK